MKEFPPGVVFRVHGVAPGSKLVVKKVTLEVSVFVALGERVTELPVQMLFVDAVIETLLGEGIRVNAMELELILVLLGQASLLGEKIQRTELF